MASPRMRRLASDYEAVRGEFSGHPVVTVTPVGFTPPETYQVNYQVPGLTLDGDIPKYSHLHRAELRLPLGYPREQPYCVPLTPMFHPNISDHFCIADYWFAGQSLVDTIRKIGDMIQYRIYNTKSPLNATAAYWAEKHPDLFPLEGSVDLGVPEIDISIG
jgi:ubiquitin-protein ligase